MVMMTTPSQMEYDADRQLQHIDMWPERATRGRIIHDIEKAQELMVPATTFRDWCEHLRFVVRAHGPGREPGDAFELVESANGQEAREPFIAISYRWPPPKEGPGLVSRRILAPEPGKQGPKHWREIRAPLDILERAFAFADAKGINKIWIDQECIHQDDDHDRRLGVQSIHLVYRWSAFTLVMLGRHITTLSDIHALPYLEVPDDRGQNIARGRIKGDEWWTRAWTAQELGLSNNNQLCYLVGWHEDLDMTGEEWERLAETENQARPVKARQDVRREWQLRGGEIFSIAFMMPMSPLLIGTLVSKLNHGTRGIGDTFVLAGASLGEPSQSLSPSSQLSEPSTLMTLASALQLITKKGCLIPSDKLAIIGNLADYAYRIDISKAQERRLGFSACALALAFFNGDLGILFNNLPGKPSTGSTFAQRAVRPLASWLPDRRSTLEHVAAQPTPSQRFQSRTARGSRSLVLDGKLAVKGLLWDVKPYTNELPSLQKDMQAALGNGDKLRVLIQAIFRLGDQGVDIDDILEAIIALSMQRQLKSLEELDSIVAMLRKWNVTKDIAEWPAVFAKLAGNDSERNEKDPDNAGARNDCNKVVVDMCEAIARGDPLMIGRCCIGQEEGEKHTTKEVHCVYYVSRDHPCETTRPTKVFSPSQSMDNYEFGDNFWMHMQPDQMHWQVKESPGNIPVSSETIDRLRHRLGGEEGADLVRVSNKVLTIEKKAIIMVSPRMSSLGCFSAKGLVPVGSAVAYCWFQ